METKINGKIIDLENENVVDKICNLKNVKVYRDEKSYGVVLVLIDIILNKNSYYKLQLLVHNVEKRYWIARYYGRIATDIGSFTLEYTFESAIKKYNELYNCRTRNKFESNRNIKNPGFYNKLFEIPIYETLLNRQVKRMKINKESFQEPISEQLEELISIIFNIKVMQETMREILIQYNYSFDKSNKLYPFVGKISQFRELLSKIQEEIYRKQNIKVLSKDKRIIELSKQYYHLINETFPDSNDDKWIISSFVKLEKEISNIDEIANIEALYETMKKYYGDNIPNKEIANSYYESMNVKIDLLGTEDSNYKKITAYFNNGQIDTKYEIVRIFQVESKFKQIEETTCQNDENRRMLLWHGTYVTRIYSILKHGFKNGFKKNNWFGPGVYFADVMGKSVSYCGLHHNKEKIGLILLCDVKVGKWYVTFYYSLINR